MKNSHAQNFKLGFFVIAGLLIFLAGVYFIGNRQNLFGTNPKISSVFKSVNGLQAGNNVRYAGVNIGTVRDITILNDTSIAVDFIINEKAMKLIRKNSMATISSDGLVGSMIVNIVPGDHSDARTIQPGDTIESISKVATADMLTTLNTTNENAALLTADLLKITNSVNRGEGTLGALIKDEKMANNIKESIAGLRQSSQSISRMVDNVNEIVNEINYKESVAAVFLSDTTAAKQMEGIIKNLELSALQIEDMASNLQQFSYDLRSGEGTVNYLLNDPGAVNKLNSTLQNVEDATRKFDENMEALQHNILFRGYFKKLERIKAREEAEKKE